MLVIVDGLRLDAARQMRTLNRLGDFAADFVLTAPQPSLSYPNWTTILSGAPPYVSGVVTNWHEGAAPVDTLLDSADAGGRALRGRRAERHHDAVPGGCEGRRVVLRAVE